MSQTFLVLEPTGVQASVALLVGVYGAVEDYRITHVDRKLHYGLHNSRVVPEPLPLNIWRLGEKEFDRLNKIAHLWEALNLSSWMPVDAVFVLKLPSVQFSLSPHLSQSFAFYHIHWVFPDNFVDLLTSALLSGLFQTSLPLDCIFAFLLLWPRIDLNFSELADYPWVSFRDFNHWINENRSVKTDNAANVLSGISIWIKPRGWDKYCSLMLHYLLWQYWINSPGSRILLHAFVICWKQKLKDIKCVKVI